jgi:hypothetical protein
VSCRWVLVCSSSSMYMCYLSTYMCYLSIYMCYLSMYMCYLSTYMCYLSIYMCYTCAIYLCTCVIYLCICAIYISICDIYLRICDIYICWDVLSICDIYIPLFHLIYKITLCLSLFASPFLPLCLPASLSLLCSSMVRFCFGGCLWFLDYIIWLFELLHRHSWTEWWIDSQGNSTSAASEYWLLFILLSARLTLLIVSCSILVPYWSSM